MGLGAADLGLVSSVYFLILAAVQIPIGSRRTTAACSTARRGSNKRALTCPFANLRHAAIDVSGVPRKAGVAIAFCGSHHLRDVAAGTERRPFPGDDDCPNGLTFVTTDQSLQQLRRHFFIEPIVGFWPLKVIQPTPSLTSKSTTGSVCVVMSSILCLEKLGSLDFGTTTAHARSPRRPSG